MSQFDRPKFKALIHYIIASCDKEELGRVKLNKVPFYADMLTWLSSGRPLTGETYRKQQLGPVSEHLSEVVRELEREGKIEEHRQPFFGHLKFTYSSKVAPDKSQFAEDELKTIDVVVDFVCRQNTARSISEFSHDEVWELAQMGEEIPYVTAINLLPVEIEQDDLDWAAVEGDRIESSRPPIHPLHSGSLRALCRQLQ